MKKGNSLNKHILIYILFNSIIVFSDYVPDILVGICMAVFAIVSILYFTKRANLLTALIYLSMELIPTSFYSVFGGGLENFPISWFQIMILLTVMHIGCTYKIKRKVFFFIGLFLMFGFLQAAFQPDVGDALKQVLMIFLCLCAFVIVDALDVSFCEYFTALKIYVSGTVAVSMQVLLQYLYYHKAGRVVGWLVPTANRLAFCGAMGDPSFTTLYIATGCVAVVLMLLEYKKMKLGLCSICFVVMLGAILCTTSRTGLYALIITLALYILLSLKKVDGKKVAVLVALVFMVPIVAQIVLNNRGGQALLDDSGRSSTYSAGIEAFLNSPLVGNGFGTKNYKLAMQMAIPHNFLIQLLAQCGTIGITIIFLPVLDCWNRTIRYADNSKWLLYCVVIGGMAIPDIASSRFLYAVIILVGMSVKNKGNAYLTGVRRG